MLLLVDNVEATNNPMLVFNNRKVELHLCKEYKVASKNYATSVNKNAGDNT